jgi:hypothetical protein
MLTEGATRKSFREQIELGLRCRGERFSVLWPFLELGEYTQQISRFLNAFPTSQIHICYFEQLERAPTQLLQDLFAFLEVDPTFVPNVAERHNQPRVPKMTTATYFLKKWGLWRRLRNLAPAQLGPGMRSLVMRSRDSMKMNPADRAFLADYYRPEVERLSALLNRDLSAWLASEGPTAVPLTEELRRH